MTWSNETNADWDPSVWDMAKTRGARSSAVPLKMSARKITIWSRLTPGAKAVLDFPKDPPGTSPGPIQHRQL